MMEMESCRCNMACATLIVSEKDFLHQNIYEVVTGIRFANKLPDLKNIHSHLAKRDNLRELRIEYFRTTYFRVGKTRQTCQ